MLRVSHESDENTQSNATLGLYSATANSPQANTAGTKAFSTQKGTLGDILYGRKPISVWDSTVKTWQKDVGNKIRSEYEAAWAKSH
jgi:putative aldouronate transport system substrate-binding protein